MKRYLPLVLLLLSMLACKTLFPDQKPVHEPGNAPDLQFPSTPTPRPTVEATLPPPTGNKFTQVELHPKDGKLTDLLAAEVDKAAAQGQLPVVEFDADW